MPSCNFKNHATGATVEGINFGGSNQVAYDAGGTIVYAPIGGTSVTQSGRIATLVPLGLTTDIQGKWTIVSHQSIGTADWRVTVQNSLTSEIKTGVYPFNITADAHVYELECQSGTWVMASCGGYKIESSWSGQQANEFYRLKGTGEIIGYIGVWV